MPDLLFFYPILSDKSSIRLFLMTFLYPSVEIDLQVKAYIISLIPTFAGAVCGLHLNRVLAHDTVHFWE